MGHEQKPGKKSILFIQLVSLITKKLLCLFCKFHVSQNKLKPLFFLQSVSKPHSHKNTEIVRITHNSAHSSKKCVD